MQTEPTEIIHFGCEGVMEPTGERVVFGAAEVDLMKCAKCGKKYDVTQHDCIGPRDSRWYKRRWPERFT